MLIAAAADRKGQHPLAPYGHGGDRRFNGDDVKGFGLAVWPELAAAAGQHRFSRALNQDPVAAVQGGHVLLLRFERNRITARMGLKGLLPIEACGLGCLQQGCFGGVAHQPFALTWPGIVAEQSRQQGFV